MRILQASLLYFAMVFGSGFVLGPIRILWLVPRVGARTAELMEMPLMAAVIFAVAPWILRRCAVPPARGTRLAVGGLALAFVLVAEFALAGALRGMSIRDYLATRDPVSGTAYYLLLAVFGALPLFVERGKAPK